MRLNEGLLMKQLYQLVFLPIPSHIAFINQKKKENKKETQWSSQLKKWLICVGRTKWECWSLKGNFNNSAFYGSFNQLLWSAPYITQWSLSASQLHPCPQSNFSIMEEPIWRKFTRPSRNNKFVHHFQTWADNQKPQDIWANQSEELQLIGEGRSSFPVPSWAN